MSSIPITTRTSLKLRTRLKPRPAPKLLLISRDKPRTSEQRVLSFSVRLSQGKSVMPSVERKISAGPRLMALRVRHQVSRARLRRACKASTSILRA